MSNESQSTPAASKRHMPHSKYSVGLRTVALIEGAKGIVVLLLAFGILGLIHKDLDEVADRLTEVLHMNPDGRLSNLFFRAADRINDNTLVVLAIAALVYAAIRFIEAFGLWHEREWAEWFAMLSGLLYLPFEIHSLLRHPRPFKWAIVALNLAIVLYMIFLRVSARKQEVEPKTP